MKIGLLHLVGCLFLILSASCQKEAASTHQDRDYPPNRVNQPVQGGEPSCAYSAKDRNGDIVIVDWQGNILSYETAELKRYALTGVREGQYRPVVGNSYSGNNEHFGPAYSEGASTSNTDGWKLAGDVANSPEFWKLVGMAIEVAINSESKPVHVDSYTDKNGRKVPEHYRSKPDKK